MSARTLRRERQGKPAKRVSRTVFADMTDLTAAMGHHRDRLAFWALAALALFVAHDAIYFVQIGPGEALATALRTAGHGYWGWATIGIVVVAFVAAVSVWLRIRHLRQHASALSATRASAGPFTRRLIVAWLRLGVVVAIGYAIQENVEHVIAHGHAPGAGALLGPEAPLALPVIGLISAVAAAFAALVARAQEALVVAIETALRRPMRTPLTGLRPASRLAAVTGSILAHPGAGRAPPTLIVAGI